MLTKLTAPQPAGAHSLATAEIQVRKARMTDLPAMLDLINGYAAGGIMLPRTEFEMAENLRDFSVVTGPEGLVACGALHFYSTTLAEVRSLAVSPAQKRSGLGRLVVESLAEEGRMFGLDAIFAFTYAEAFFSRLGFAPVERGLLPLKVWKDCVRCSRFSCCDEVAMVRMLSPDQEGVLGHSFAGPSEFNPEENLGIVLPIQIKNIEL